MKIYWKVVLGVIAVLLCGVFYVCTNVQKKEVAVLEGFAAGEAVAGQENLQGRTGTAESFQNTAAPDTAALDTTASDTATSNTAASDRTELSDIRSSGKESVYIDIGGEVKKPGVYQFDHEPRLVEVIEKAGGFTKRADSSSVNQAQTVSDGTQVIIASKSGKGGGNSSQNSGESGDGNNAAGVRTEQNDTVDDSGGPGTDGKVDLNTASKEQLMSLTGIGESRAKDILSYREEKGGFQSIEDIMKVPGIKDGIFNQIKDNIKV